MIIVPISGEVLNVVAEKENYGDHSSTVLNDKFSGILSLSMGLGGIISPIIGGWLYI